MKITGLELVSPISALTFPRGQAPGTGTDEARRMGGKQRWSDGMGEQHKAGGRPAGRGLAALPRGTLT